MRVAIVDPSLFSPPYDLALAKALQANGADVKIFSRRTRPGEHKFTEGLQALHFYRFSEFLLDRLGQKFFIKVIKGLEHFLDILSLIWTVRTRYDVLHLQWLTLPLFDWLLLRSLKGRVPIVLTLHDSKPFLGGETSRLQTLGWRRCLDLADRIIVHTQKARENWIRYGLDAQKIVILPHGDLQLGGSEVGTALAPEAFVRPFPEKAILLFGIIKHYKGLDLLLRAYAQVAPELRRGWKLWVVGKAFDDIAPNQTLALDLGIADEICWDLRFVADEEIPSFYTQAEIMVFPYREIDASGVFLSSLRYGRPTIASRVGLFAELLKHNDSALLFERENVEGLVACLQALILEEPLRQKLSKGLQKVAEAQTSWNEIGEKTLELYKGLRQ